MEPKPALVASILLSRGEICLLKLWLISSAIVSGSGGDSMTGDIERCPRSFIGFSNGDDLRGRSCFRAAWFRLLEILKDLLLARDDSLGVFRSY